MAGQWEDRHTGKGLQVESGPEQGVGIWGMKRLGREQPMSKERGSMHKRWGSMECEPPWSSSSQAAALTVLIKTQVCGNISPLCSIQVAWN
jgi:hypothetical protein